MALLEDIYTQSIEFKKRVEEDQHISVLSQDYLEQLTSSLSSDFNQEGKLDIFIKTLSINALLRKALVEGNLTYIEGLVIYANERGILKHVIKLGLIEEEQELTEEVIQKYDNSIIIAMTSTKKYVFTIDVAALSMYLANSLRDANQERLELLYQDMFLEAGALYSKRITLMDRAGNILNSFREMHLATKFLANQGNSLFFKELIIPFEGNDINTLKTSWSIQTANKFGILLKLIQSIKQQGLYNESLWEYQVSIMQQSNELNLGVAEEMALPYVFPKSIGSVASSFVTPPQSPDRPVKEISYNSPPATSKPFPVVLVIHSDILEDHSSGGSSGRSVLGSPLMLDGDRAVDIEPSDFIDSRSLVVHKAFTPEDQLSGGSSGRSVLGSPLMLEGDGAVNIESPSVADINYAVVHKAFRSHENIKLYLYGVERILASSMGISYFLTEVAGPFLPEVVSNNNFALSKPFIGVMHASVLFGGAIYGQDEVTQVVINSALVEAFYGWVKFAAYSLSHTLKEQHLSLPKYKETPIENAHDFIDRCIFPMGLDYGVSYYLTQSPAIGIASSVISAVGCYDAYKEMRQDPSDILLSGVFTIYSAYNFGELYNSALDNYQKIDNLLLLLNKVNMMHVLSKGVLEYLPGVREYLNNAVDYIMSDELFSDVDYAGYLGLPLMEEGLI
jgi:hypothetical protein